MSLRHGFWVVSVLIVVSIFMFIQGMPAPQASPVFVSTVEPPPCYLELRGDFFDLEQCCVVDARNHHSVIELVKSARGKRLLERYFLMHGVVSGQSIEIKTTATSALVIESGYMGAGRRMALAIPLHPDRMTREDWQVLPRVGKKLSLAIEDDRHIHGNFGSFEQLSRVRGIGRKTLARWETFFVNNNKN